MLRIRKAPALQMAAPFHVGFAFFRATAQGKGHPEYITTDTVKIPQEVVFFLTALVTTILMVFFSTTASRNAAFIIKSTPTSFFGILIEPWALVPALYIKLHCSSRPSENCC